MIEINAIRDTILYTSKKYCEEDILVKIPKVKLQEKTVTENGDVIPDSDYDGLSKVSVNVPIKLQNKTITENGTYYADASYNGIGKVTVNVPSGSGHGFSLIWGVLEPQMTSYINDVIMEV